MPRNDYLRGYPRRKRDIEIGMTLTDFERRQRAIRKRRTVELPDIKKGDAVESLIDPSIKGIVESVEGRVVRIDKIAGTFAITSLKKL